MRRYDSCGTPQKLHKPNASTRVFWSNLQRVLDPFQIISTRGAYYQAESAGLVTKDDAGYNKVQRAVLAMRRHRLLSYDKIRDTTRVRRRVWSVETFQQAADSLLEQYRYDYWADQPYHVEVWCEKEALTPQIEPICQEFGVHYAATRGFDSESFAYETAEQLRHVPKPIRIYYLGDHDPSGWWAAKTMEEGLRQFRIRAEVYHVAVLPEQIRQYRLPTRRATKTDTRYAAFVREFGTDLAVEVDAIPPPLLARMVRHAIQENIEPDAWSRAQRNEELQRETTQSVMSVWSRMAPGEVLR